MTVSGGTPVVYVATLGKKINVVVKNLASAIKPGAGGQEQAFIEFCRRFHPLVQKAWVFALNILFPILLKWGVRFDMLMAESKDQATLLFRRVFSVYLALGKKDRLKQFQKQTESLLELFGNRLPEDAKLNIKVSF